MIRTAEQLLQKGVAHATAQLRAWWWNRGV